MTSDKSVVLLSGGLDSAVLVQRVHATGAALPLFVDYGQRAVARERTAAEALCRARGLELQVLDATGVRNALYASRLPRPHSPLPLRNLVIVALALSYADFTRAKSVSMAVVRDDVGGYACTGASFFYALRDLAVAAGDVRIETPFIHLEKAAVVEEGLSLGVELVRTYSCMLGRETHCGRCRQCLLRREAARRGGLVEPAEFYLHAAPANSARIAPTSAARQSTSGAWRW